jgi:transposase
LLDRGNGDTRSGQLKTTLTLFVAPSMGRMGERNSCGSLRITPERLLRALLLQSFYSVRSERLLMEQLDYNLLFRWFVGMNMDEQVWVATVFPRTATGC